MSSQNNDSVFCAELIQGVNPLFRISSLFADKSVSTRLPPLYAFFAAINQLCFSVSDEAVAIRKLGWWRDAMLDGEKASQDHPVISELERTGVLGSMPADVLARMFEVTAYRIEAPSTPGLQELESLCLMIGSPQLELELAVSGAGTASHSFHDSLPIRRGLMQLIREGLERERSAWWVPLDLLAKHGVRRDELADETAEKSAQALMNEILSIDAVSAEIMSVKTDISNNNQYDRHIYVFDALTARKLKHMKLSSYNKQREALFRPSVADLFCCWGAARQFNRQK